MANWRDELKLEPYDPNAEDGDGDGIVQDGTAWERPAGARLFDRSGQEILPGRTSETPVRDLIYRDPNGTIIQYRPKPRPKQPEQKPDSTLGPTLKDRSGTIGDQRTLGNQATAQRQREAELEAQRQRASELQAIREAAAQRRRQFAEIINNLPTRKNEDTDPFVNLNDKNESVTSATAKANFIYGLLGQSLNAKAELAEARGVDGSIPEERLDEIFQKYPDIDPENLDDQIEQLNAAAKALFGMNIEEQITDRNARKHGKVTEELNDAFAKSIREQGRLLNYLDTIEDEDLNENLENQSEQILQRMDTTLQQYAGFAEAATTAQKLAQNYENPQVGKQLRDQNFKFLAVNDIVDRIQRAQQKIRDAYYNKRSKNRTREQNGTQGTLNTLYPSVALQPNHPILGNLTENNPDPENPLPQPTNNPLAIEVDLDENIEPNSDVERVIIVAAAVEHLRSGGSLADIPNDYWYDTLSVASSDVDIDTENPFYEITPSEGAVAITTIFWRRNADGTPSNQGYVVKVADTSMGLAEHSAWNVAAALGIYPEGSNWGGYVEVEPNAANNWETTMPVVVAPIVWNHLPTDENLTNLVQNRSYETNYTNNGAAKRQLAAALHTYIIGDTDRNPGNTISGYLDGETYIFPIDFGSSGGFVERQDFDEYITVGGSLNSYSRFLPELAAYRETMTAEERERLDQELVDTYDAMLQRSEQLLRTNTEEQFIEAMLPQNPWNYPDFDEDMARRELAAFYGGIENATRKMRAERSKNLRLLLGEDNSSTAIPAAPEPNLSDRTQSISSNRGDVSSTGAPLDGPAFNVEDLRSAVEPAQQYRTRPDGRVFPDTGAIDIRRDPIKAGDPYDSFVNWEESEEGSQLANALETAGERFINAVEEEIYGGPVPQSVKDARQKFYEDREKFVEDIGKRKEKNSLGWSLAEEQTLEDLRDLATTQKAKDALNEAIKTAEKEFKSAKRKNEPYTPWRIFSREVSDLIIESLIAEGAIRQLTPEEINQLPDDDFRKVFNAENKSRAYAEDSRNPLLKKLTELFGPELSEFTSVKTDTPAQPSATIFRQIFGSASFQGSAEMRLKENAVKRLLTPIAADNGAPDPDWDAFFKLSPLPRFGETTGGPVYPPELSNDRIAEVDYLSDKKKNAEAFIKVLTSLRDDIGTGSLLEIFDEKSIRPNRDISRQDILQGLERLSKILPGRWIDQFKQAHPDKQAWQWVQRGHYDNGKIAISGGDWERTMVHELGHAFEQTIAGVYQAEQLFYNRRYKQLYENAKKKPPYRKVSSTQGWTQNGFPLQLNDPYADVVYTDQSYFELFSMSLEDIYNGKIDKMPPEQIRFVLGVLALL